MRPGGPSYEIKKKRESELDGGQAAPAFFDPCCAKALEKLCESLSFGVDHNLDEHKY